MKAKRARVAPVAAVASIAAALLFAPSAFAAERYTRTGQFSGEGSGAGLLSRPKRVAVEARTGNVFITDSENNRIQVFRPSGRVAAYLTDFGTGVLDAPYGIALDQSNGDLFVSDSGNNRIVKFTSDHAAVPTYTRDNSYTGPAAGNGAGQVGSFASDIELAPNGDLLVADTGDNKVQRYAADGSFISEFNGAGAVGGTFTGLRDIAVDSRGQVLAVDSSGDILDGGTSRVVRFRPDGTYVATVGPVATPDSVAIDPRNDDVVVGGNVYDSYWDIGYLRLYVFDSAGAARSQTEMPSSIAYSMLPGVAVDGGNAGHLYVVTDTDPYGDGYGVVSVQVYAPPPGPEAVTLGAQATESSAGLYGRVQPNGTATTYWFEYGTSDSYGQSIPVARDGSAGSGRAFVEVSRQLVNLQPGTTYHFRIAARSEAGTSYGADRTFSVSGDVLPGPTPGLPDGRRLELVSPGFLKGSGELSARFVQVSPDGERAIYQVNNVFGDADNGLGGLNNSLTYQATRGENGWSSTFLTRPPQPANATRTMFYPFHVVASNDARRSFFSVTYDSSTGYTSGMWMGEPGKPSEELAQKPASATRIPDVVGLSDDGSRRALASEARLGSIPGNPATTGNTLWEHSSDGLRLINADDDGELLHPAGAAFASGGGPSSGTALPATTHKHAMSVDGSRIFFLSREPGAPNNAPLQLFVRIDGTRTVEVSASAHTAPQPALQTVNFAGASADGTTVAFVTNGRLTDDAIGAGPFLYVYELPIGSTQGTLSLAADGTRPVTTALETDSSTSVVAQTLVSDDGSRVYYRTADAGGTIYVYDTRSRETSTVATGVGAAVIAGQVNTTTMDAVAEATPDGRYLVFSSSEPLVAGPADTNDGLKLYRYTAGDGNLELVSGTPTAPPTRFDVAIRSRSGRAGMKPLSIAVNPHGISDDGRYVFFETDAALVPTDTNGKTDVYRWREGSGVALVTDGSSKSDSYLADASADGTSVFFLTMNDLLPQDGDGFFDLYAARVGGGFSPPEAPETCLGDACQGSPTAPPATPKSLTDAFSGPGNAEDPDVSPVKPRLSSSTLTGKQQQTLRRGGVATLKVKSNVAGTVTGRLSVRSGKRWVLVSSAKQKVGAGGTARLGLRLSKKMRTALARRSLTVRVEVSHSKSNSTVRRTYVLRTVKAAARAASVSTVGGQR
jgi:WD40 repeat protein